MTHLESVASVAVPSIEDVPPAETIRSPETIPGPSAESAQTARSVDTAPSGKTILPASTISVDTSSSAGATSSTDTRSSTDTTSSVGATSSTGATSSAGATSSTDTRSSADAAAGGCGRGRSCRRPSRRCARRGCGGCTGPRGSPPARATARCRSRSRRSGSGSSTGCSRERRRTTSRVRCGCSGALDVAALERALGEIVRRHEALRTTFREARRRAGAGDRPLRRLPPPGGRPRSGDGPGARGGRRPGAGADAARPFDLEAGPLFRAALLRLERRRARAAALHAPHRERRVEHGRAVRASWRRCTGRSARGGPSPLAAAAGAVRRLRRLAARAAGGAAGGAELAYWRERLAGAPALLELPTDRPRPAVQTFRGGSEPVRLRRPSCWTGWRRWAGARAPRCTWCCWAPSRCSCRATAAATTWWWAPPSPGAPAAEVEALIGLFMNTLALRTDLAGDPPFREVLRRVRER